MTEILQANIFFLITAVSVIVLTILTIVLLVYAIKTIRDISHITTKVREESDNIVQDVKEIRENITKSSPISAIISLFTRMGGPSKGRGTRVKRDKE